MRILIAGGTGMIGTALTESLLSDGHPVWVLTRNPARAHLPQGVTALGWDGRTATGWAEVLSQMDAVVNLVGESLTRWPWTRQQKQCFWDSRVQAGQALTRAIQAASPLPQVLIQASGANFMGRAASSPLPKQIPPERISWPTCARPGKPPPNRLKRWACGVPSFAPPSCFPGTPAFCRSCCYRCGCSPADRSAPAGRAWPGSTCPMSWPPSASCSKIQTPTAPIT
jgi:hypothetical protein